MSIDDVGKASGSAAKLQNLAVAMYQLHGLVVGIASRIDIFRVTCCYTVIICFHMGLTHIYMLNFGKRQIKFTPYRRSNSIQQVKLPLRSTAWWG
jgi:hypothetical protein